MDKTELLVKNLISKDENAAQSAACEIINNSNLDAFKLLQKKTVSLFDFVKENISRRLKKAVNNSNYMNLLDFFKVHSPDFEDSIIEALVNYADEDLTDTIFNILETGSSDEKIYAAKYFSHIPDTIALDLLEKYAFDENEFLMFNCAKALSKMNNDKAFSYALEMLNSEDEFDKLKAVKFLVAYGNKDAAEKIYNTMLNSSFSENIAAEFPYLISLKELFDSGKKEISLIILHNLRSRSEVMSES